MEYITERIEGIIEDLLSDDEMDKDEIIQILNELKDEIEERELRRLEDEGLQWEDLD